MKTVILLLVAVLSLCSCIQVSDKVTFQGTIGEESDITNTYSNPVSCTINMEDIRKYERENNLVLINIETIKEKGLRYICWVKVWTESYDHLSGNYNYQVEMVKCSSSISLDEAIKNVEIRKQNNEEWEKYLCVLRKDKNRNLKEMEEKYRDRMNIGKSKAMYEVQHWNLVSKKKISGFFNGKIRRNYIFQIQQHGSVISIGI
jgi:hypothetical protein